MEIVHRIAFYIDDERRKSLEQLGIDYGDDTDDFVGFDISEASPSWKPLCKLVEKWDTTDIASLKFTKVELEGAGSLEMWCCLRKGYPMPDHDFSYRKATYEFACSYPDCGIQMNQTGLFRMKQEPRCSKRHIFQLHWVDDEFFVHPEIWRELFRPVGVGCRPVLIHKSGKPAQGVVQLDIPVSDVPLKLEKHAFVICPMCGRKKYEPKATELLPPFQEQQKADMVKTQAFFGDGASAGRYVIISQKFFRIMREAGIRGVKYEPLMKRKIMSQAD